MVILSHTNTDQGMQIEKHCFEHNQGYLNEMTWFTWPCLKQFLTTRALHGLYQIILTYQFIMNNACMQRLRGIIHIQLIQKYQFQIFKTGYGYDLTKRSE